MKDSQPQVSICIPTYNAGATIGKTLQSLLGQTYSNYTIHISDNVSSDETLDIVTEMADEKVFIHQNPVNIGGEENFNRCIELGEGKYVAVYHADDIYEPDIVARQVAFLESHPEAAAVFTGATVINERDEPVGRIRLPADVASRDGLYDFVTMFKAVLKHSNFFICPSVMFRLPVLYPDKKWWDEDLFKTSADLGLWLKILRRAPVGYLNEPLMRYRVSATQGSAVARQNTGRAHFFLVTDYFLAQKEVQALLDENDLRNYRWLERRDRLMRALNLLCNDEYGRAKELSRDVCSLDAVRAALAGKRGVFVLLLGCYLRSILFLRLYGFGKVSVRKIRSVLNR